mmetsp:Transcript_94867/g.255179  ORF Transcript_94867/g.255179 Transcript_94867/m.255179 type:complete len:320 (-) Transcript_94867:2250-3209(-)
MLHVDIQVLCFLIRLRVGPLDRGPDVSGRLLFFWWWHDFLRGCLCVVLLLFVFLRRQFWRLQTCFLKSGNDLRLLHASRNVHTLQLRQGLQFRGRHCDELSHFLLRRPRRNGVFEIHSSALVLFQQLGAVVLLIALLTEEGLAIHAENRGLVRRLFFASLAFSRHQARHKARGFRSRFSLGFWKAQLRLLLGRLARVGVPQLLLEKPSLGDLGTSHGLRDGQILLVGQALVVVDVGELCHPLVVLSNPANTLGHLHDSVFLQRPSVITHLDFLVKGSAFLCLFPVPRIAHLPLCSGGNRGSALVGDPNFLQCLHHVALF